MAKKENLRVGVIGVGRMGTFHVNCYSQIPDVTLVGVSDKDAKRGKKIADKFKIKYHADYKELLGEVDIATISVPTKLHYEIAKEALLADTHLLVEKPVSNNYENAKELFDIADKRGLIIHVGHVERFNGAVQELSKLIDEPWLIQSRRLGPYDARVAEDGVVMDLMIHDIDIILNLVKSPVKSINVMGNSVVSHREDIVGVQIMFESGCMATITASRATHTKIRNMAISCKEKYMKLDFAAQEIKIHKLSTTEHEIRSSGESGTKELKYKETETVERIFVHRENPLKIELQHLVDCVLGREERYVSVKNELQSLDVALKIVDKYNEAN